jgi:hypothetical protein
MLAILLNFQLYRQEIQRFSAEHQKIGVMCSQGKRTIQALVLKSTLWILLSYLWALFITVKSPCEPYVAKTQKTFSAE